MRELYPGNDVLAKRETPSWNDKTREVVDARLAVEEGAPRFFNSDEYDTLRALCDSLCPQDPKRVPLAALVDEKMHLDRADGYRLATMPGMRTAWRRGLAALDASSRTLHDRRFHACPEKVRQEIIESMAKGELDESAWDGMSPRDFFQTRVLPDVVKSFYSHPAAWSDIGFGGPASPRGYVRMDFDERDPWEAAEAHPGDEERAMRENRRVGR